MWVRRCEIDAQLEAPLPVPTQLASNEEFIPPPQSDEQLEAEHHALEIAEKQGKRHGLSRRDCLRTGSGMAASIMAMNMVFGDCYEVKADEVEDQDAAKERWPKNEFILD